MKKALLVTALLVLAPAGCKEEGMVAMPDLNPAPSRAMILDAEVLRSPADVDPRGISEYMFARYESRRLECSQVRHMAGGSVVFPSYEVPVQRDERGRFVVWTDLIKPDRCHWTLTLVQFGLTADGASVLETAFPASTFQQGPKTHYCAWEGPLNGNCRAYRPIRNDLIDDTTVRVQVAAD